MTKSNQNFETKLRKRHKIKTWNPKTQSLSRVEFEFNCSIFRVKYKTIYLRFTQNEMHKIKWSRSKLHRHRSEVVEREGQVAHISEKEKGFDWENWYNCNLNGATMKPATKTIKRMLNRKLTQKENARRNLHKPMTNGSHARRWLEGMKWNEHEK